MATALHRAIGAPMTGLGGLSFPLTVLFPGRFSVPA
jgi:hypothetical protein